MITAAQFLAAAALHGDEEELFLAALRAISTEADRTKRDYVGFKLTVPPGAITLNVAKAIQIHLRKDGWNAELLLMARKSPIDGSDQPVHWSITVTPTEAENDAAVVRFKGREN